MRNDNYFIEHVMLQVKLDDTMVPMSPTIIKGLLIHYDILSIYLLRHWLRHILTSQD